MWIFDHGFFDSVQRFIFGGLVNIITLVKPDGLAKQSTRAYPLTSI